MTIVNKEPTTAGTRSRGFTLIELMIVVVIVAILATIAIPGYQRYIRNAERDFAITWLSDKEATLERVRMRTGGYPRDSGGALDRAAIGEALTGTSATTFYLARRSGLSTTETNTSRYRVDILAGDGNRPALRLTTVQQQLPDTTCAQMTLNANGSRSATSKGGTNTTADCWR